MPNILQRFLQLFRRKPQRPPDRPAAIEARVKIKRPGEGRLDVSLEPVGEFQLYPGEYLTVAFKIEDLFDGKIIQCPLQYDPKACKIAKKKYVEARADYLASQRDPI